MIAGLPGFRPTFDGHPQPAQLAASGRSPRPSGRSSWPATASCIAEAWDELRAFAEKTQIPVARTLLGVGRDGRDASPRLRLHGHARLEARQPGHPVGRPADRPRACASTTASPATSAPTRRTRGSSTSTSTRRDRQERGRRGPDRGRRRPRPAGPDAAGRAGRPIAERAPSTSPSWRSGARVARRSSWHGSGAWRDGAPVRRLRGRADRRADRPRRDLRGRRRPEPDVAGALRRLPPAEQPHQLGWPGHDGLRGPGGHGRRPRPARQGDLGDRRRRRLPDDDRRS